MSSRRLATAATLWLGLYLATYAWFVRSQDGDPAGWYVGLLVVAALCCAAAAVSRSPVLALAGLLLTAAAALAGLLSLGLLLVPALGALIGAVLIRQPPVPVTPAT